MQSELYGRRHRNYKHWHDRDYAVRSFIICNICDLLFGLMRIGGRGGVSPIATMLRAGRKGVRIPVGDFLISKHFPKGYAHPASNSIRTRAPFWGQCGRSATMTTHLPFTAVWDSVDMDKTLHRNGYIFIITRYVLITFPFVFSPQSYNSTLDYTFQNHSPLVSEQTFFFRQLYPGSNPVAHSVGVGRARRAQKALVYWMELGLPFMTPRVYANCSEPLPYHRKYSTSDQRTVLVYL